MNCPVCRTALIAVEREGIEVDWCLACRGLWFDEGEIELLAEKTGRTIDLADLRTSEAGKPRRCPRCDKKMRLAAVGPGREVKIDCCLAHGIWLDRGELGQILSGSVTDDPVRQFLGETFSMQVEQRRRA